MFNRSVFSLFNVPSVRGYSISIHSASLQLFDIQSFDDLSFDVSCSMFRHSKVSRFMFSRSTFNCFDVQSVGCDLEHLSENVRKYTREC
jgi:hypothetical protein